MKSFQKFLEEVTIKGNPAIPGENGKKPGDKDYLRDIESRAKARLGISGRENPMQFGGRIMQLLSLSQRMTRGHEKELEKLAKEIILKNYGEILDGVELDIKLFGSGQQIAKFMKNVSKEQKEQQEVENNKNYPVMRQIKDPDTINKIHKAKIGNNIIQGEAKNTKHIIATEEVKNGLIKIFGDKAEQLLNIWKEISNLADKMDWIIPIDNKAEMMERVPDGMAGAVSIDWKPKEDQSKEDENKDFATKILNDLANEIEPEEKDIEKLQDEFELMQPRIRARGIDFPMLIHETVKGIYELIASVQFPSKNASEDEIKKAQTVELNVSSFMDEAEDFRTGPEIAADFRDFINANPKATHPNMRAFIFGMLMDSNYISDEEFLKLFRGILNGTQEARKKIDEMIDEVNKKLNQYELSQVIDIEEPEIEIPQNSNQKKDYSEMSQKQIQELIDDALDAGDMDKVKILSQYLKEGAKIYLSELKKLNEGYIPHNKLKKK
jgi:hypothetical protein